MKKEFNPLLSLKINAISTLILILLFICSTLFLKIVERDILATVHTLQLDNGNGAMLAIVVMRGVVGIVLVSYSLFIPFLMPVFNHFINNLKSLIGIVLCNLGISFIFYVHFTLQLAIFYFVLTLVGICGSMYLKYQNQQ